MNLICNIYSGAGAPPAVPRITSICSLSLGALSATAIAKGASQALGDYGGMWLLLPIGTDIRDASAATGRDGVECPAGSGRIYDVAWVDDIGGGYPNEHRFAEIIKKGVWPTPFPSVGPGPLPVPPAAPVQTGQVTSAGALVNALAMGVLVPGNGMEFISVTIWDQAAIPVVTWNGVPLVLTIASPLIGAAGHTVATYQYAIPVAMAAYAVLVTLPGALLGAIDIQTVFWAPPNNVLVGGQSNSALAALPTCPVVIGGLVAPEITVASYATIGIAVADIATPPFVPPGANFLNVIGGVNCNASQYYAIQVVPGTSPLFSAGALPAAFTAGLMIAN